MTEFWTYNIMTPGSNMIPTYLYVCHEHAMQECEREYIRRFVEDQGYTGLNVYWHGVESIKGWEARFEPVGQPMKFVRLLVWPLVLQYEEVRTYDYAEIVRERKRKLAERRAS